LTLGLLVAGKIVVFSSEGHSLQVFAQEITAMALPNGGLTRRRISIDHPPAYLKFNHRAVRVWIFPGGASLDIPAKEAWISF